MPLPSPPALLVDGEPVESAEGVILSPEEVCAAISAAGYIGDAALLEILETELERMMEEWEGD